MLSPTTDGLRRAREAMLRGWVYAVLIAVIAAGRASGQWRIEGQLGDAWSLPSQITFSQGTEPDIATTAHWSTHPLEPTIYYAWRLVRWSGHTGWGLEYTHHKLYLDNPPPGVAYFRITNGVNFFVPERLWSLHGWEVGAGAGPVLVVPVSSVRGAVYDNAHGLLHSRYEFGGGVLEATLVRRVRLLSFVGGLVSLKVSAAYLRGHIVDGHVTTANFALHAGYGLSIGRQ